VDAIAEKDLDQFYERAKRIAEKHGRPVEEVITMLRPPTPNGLPQQAKPENEKEEKSSTTD